MRNRNESGPWTRATRSDHIPVSRSFTSDTYLRRTRFCDTGRLSLAQLDPVHVVQLRSRASSPAHQHPRDGWASASDTDARVANDLRRARPGIACGARMARWIDHGLPRFRRLTF